MISAAIALGALGALAVRCGTSKMLGGPRFVICLTCSKFYLLAAKQAGVERHCD
jgi:hypothetical protein